MEMAMGLKGLVWALEMVCGGAAPPTPGKGPRWGSSELGVESWKGISLPLDGGTLRA